jgi:deoxyribonuclease-4
VHAGSAVDARHRDVALAQMRELVLPLLDDLADGDPDLLVEPTAGGGRPLAATVDDLAPLFDALNRHPRLGVCLDTCHAFAAGHDVSTASGVRSLLDRLVEVVGPGRLRLVHANDSKDALGSGRDRHANIGGGLIGSDAFAGLFGHPAMDGVAVLIETGGDEDTHRRDLATLRSLRDA